MDKYLRAFAALLGCALLAACGSGDLIAGGTAATPSTSSTTPSATPSGGVAAPSRDRLLGTLITVQDLPSGYVPAASGAGSDGEVVDQQACRAVFASLDRQVPSSSVVADAAVSFLSRDAVGDVMAEHVSGLRDAATARTAIQAMTAALDQCRRFTTHTGAGVTVRYQVVDLAFPPLGEQSYATRLKVDNGELQLASDLAVVRVGQCLALFGASGLAGGESGSLEKAARAAVARLGPVC